MAALRKLFTAQFREDYAYWCEVDPKVCERIEKLIDAIVTDPFRGIGKPEPLRHALRGSWSRRITKEHRLVYRVAEGAVTFLQCRYHYD